jgi:hypothetical protein
MILLCSNTSVSNDCSLAKIRAMSINEQFSSCIFYGQGKCNVYLRQKDKAHQDLVRLSMLNEDILRHSLSISVDPSSYTERSLITSRMGVKDICNNDDLIYPYHRYAYGIMWRPSMLCQSPYHIGKKPKGAHTLLANFYAKLMEMEFFKGNKTHQFPVGPKVCRTCLIKIKFICANKTHLQQFDFQN